MSSLTDLILLLQRTGIAAASSHGPSLFSPKVVFVAAVRRYVADEFGSDDTADNDGES